MNKELEHNIEDKIDDSLNNDELKRWQDNMLEKVDEGAYEPSDLRKQLYDISKRYIQEYYRKHRRFGIFSGVAAAFGLMRGQDYSDIQKKIVEDVETRIKFEERKLNEYRSKLYALQDKFSLRRRDITELRDKLKKHESFMEASSKQLQELESLISYKRSNSAEQPKLEYLSPEVLNYSLEELFDEKEKLVRIVSHARTEEQKIKYNISKIGGVLDGLGRAVKTQEVTVHKQEEELSKAYKVHGFYASKEFAVALKEFLDQAVRHVGFAKKLSKSVDFILGPNDSIKDVLVKAMKTPTPDIVSKQTVESFAEVDKALDDKRKKQIKKSAEFDSKVEEYIEKYAL
ncbi:hypothetical protein B6U93_04100 [Candidatus Woesearchaeota archaeon ex4484_78]|nr:MAG: hypothetical protein B6U93_04100 [Candidatus Woesearchaeota archaeon ex4484_78]